MKREILRINSLNYVYAGNRKLENLSMCILEGESVGFLGLTYSGKDLLVRLLCGEAEADICGLNIYVDGTKMSDQEELVQKVYRIAASNYLIDDWTVAEYIGLVDSSWFQMLWNRRHLEEETDAYFKELGIPFDVSRKMKELTELEKRIADMVKARSHGARIVIVEDEFEGMRPESIGEFAHVMKRLAKGNMAVIVNSHSDMVLSILSDKYIIMKKGRIVKKCSKDYIQDSSHLEKFLLGGTIKSKKQDMDSYTLEQSEEKKTVYRVRGLELKDGRKGDFNFFKGEVVTFLVLDGKEKERLFLVLSGRKPGRDNYCIIDSKEYASGDFSGFVQGKIVSVMHMGSKEEVFTRMSAGQNLLLPSLGKISSVEYIISSGRISKMLKQNMDSDAVMPDMEAGDLEINDLISITLERWYIYNPKVLVLFEPFAQCDVYGVSIVKSYIKKFANRGTAVIILKSREEYVEDISDKIISLD
ncbi:hypothetical protein [Dorea sp. D27]|uniref:hypothetical protein n=1 Tax=Dorea sp. D27 TaxID=658665 RepID=UPI000673B065|nr:hypothetical protein [Dorea sp. D27]KMZ54128.1 hypothetical protein HMPREF0980_01794 [Dorea sp. D27]